MPFSQTLTSVRPVRTYNISRFAGTHNLLSSRRVTRKRRPSSDGHVTHLASPRALPWSVFSFVGLLRLTVRPFGDWVLAVPGTSELLVLSPMMPRYTVHNPYLNVSTTVTVDGFDPRSVNATVPGGAAAYVQSVRVNNVTQASLCHFDFYDTFRVGADIVITVTADRAAANSCGASVPQSVSTGGFAMTR